MFIIHLSFLLSFFLSYRSVHAKGFASTKLKPQKVGIEFLINSITERFRFHKDQESPQTLKKFI